MAERAAGALLAPLAPASCASCSFPTFTTPCRSSTGWFDRRRRFDLVVLAGDQLDISSTVSLDAQSVVILRYLALLQAAGRVVIGSGNHDLTGPDAQGEQSALWLAEARATGVPTDGDSLTIGDTLVTICPWWDGPARSSRPRGAARGRRAAAAAALGLGLPLAAARLADLLDRQAPLRRCGCRRLDRGAPARPRPHRPCPRVAVQAARDRGPTGSAPPGSSTPAGRSARCRAMSTSIWRRERPRGDR